jgi:hypothetical protein
LSPLKLLARQRKKEAPELFRARTQSLCARSCRAIIVAADANGATASALFQMLSQAHSARRFENSAPAKRAGRALRSKTKSERETDERGVGPLVFKRKS